MRTDYSHQRFRHAVYALAVGPGDVRSRLLSVYVDDLSPISAVDLPPELKDDYVWVLQQLSKFRLSKKELEGGYWRYGHVEHTLRRIRNSTGARIAERICHIDWMLRNEYTE